MIRARGSLALVALFAFTLCGCKDEAPARTDRRDPPQNKPFESAQGEHEPTYRISPPEPVPGKVKPAEN